MLKLGWIETLLKDFKDVTLTACILVKSIEVKVKVVGVNVEVYDIVIASEVFGVKGTFS